MNKIRLLWVSIILSCFVIGCEDDNDLTCGYIDPINEIEWLAEPKGIVDESCNSVILSLFQGKCKRKTVFYIRITDPRVSAEFSATLHNCEEEIIKKLDNSEMQDFLDKVKDRHVIYSCEQRR